jgi:hypothetical protein
VVLEKALVVRWGSHVCQTRLMMKNEDAPDLFRIYSAFPGGHLTKKPARIGCAPASARKVQYS